MPRTRATATGVTVTTTTETVVATLPPITAQAGQPVDLLADADLTTGTGVTAVTFNIRRGTTTSGTLVQAIGPVAASASTRIAQVVEAIDTQNSDIAGQQYVITVVQAGATGNGTANYGEIRADWTSPGTV
jgi:hypothetical protein